MHLIRRLSLLYLLGFFLLSFGLNAKEAVPIAIDQDLEKRVNAIAEELRCLVCQNQTIADSHAELAIDLKNQVRTMVAEGKSQDDILDYMVKRYGDFVRYRPPVKPTTYALWAGPFVLLLLGFVVLLVNIKRRPKLVVDTPLSAEQNQEISALLTASDSTATGGNEGKLS